MPLAVGKRNKIIGREHEESYFPTGPIQGIKSVIKVLPSALMYLLGQKET
jgi:hypothetical protein